MGFDRPLPRLQTTKNVLLYPSRHILSQHPLSYPSKWERHGVTEGVKTANVAKMAEKCLNCKSSRPTPPHTNPMELGPRNIFLTLNRKKPKDSCFSTKKKVGVTFSTFLNAPPPPSPDPPPSRKSSKKCVSCGLGGLGGGGSGPKTHWGMCLLDQIMISQGVKLIIQPLGVGYANRPKRPKMGGGGYVAFSPKYEPTWL